MPTSLRMAALAFALAATPAYAQQADLRAHLERALDIDAEYQGLRADRGATAARQATVDTIIAGSPALSGNSRLDTRGPSRAWDAEIELAAPMWLPGQRDALGRQVTAQIGQADSRIVERRLVVAGLLRDAWWSVYGAEVEERLARERVATARDMGRDVARRASLGDISDQESLIARNDTLAAELELSRAEASHAAALAAYGVLTGGGIPGSSTEPKPSHTSDLRNHPIIHAAETAVETARREVGYVLATPRENPELGVFGRTENGNLTEQGSSVGVRIRLPLATEGRNRPRRAAAEASLTRAMAQLRERERSVAAEVRAAEAAVTAAENAAKIARERLTVAEAQLSGARRMFESGETGLFDLYRVRQLQVEAAAADGGAQTALGRARSRLAQALGLVPGI